MNVFISDNVIYVIWSVTEIIIKFCGGTIYYKTKFQDTIALSPTKVEFTAVNKENTLYGHNALLPVRLDQAWVDYYETNQHFW